jgi:hypothetical protein
MNQPLDKKQNPSDSNRRLAFILFSVVLMFFIGIYAKKVFFG